MVVANVDREPESEIEDSKWYSLATSAYIVVIIARTPVGEQSPKECAGNMDAGAGRSHNAAGEVVNDFFIKPKPLIW